ncbi:MAG: hypothetical protein A2033_02400 [Bacteroidetes bacterium GWA2_31_9]|nr:MAG: hypothetical protein A2033_02400 [Bacteroidetes bacterium GWA2_31_9]
MENTFSILVWMNKSKANSKNKAPIYGRITVNGKRAEIALKIFIEPDRWDSSKGYVKGNKEDAKNINNSIDNFIIRVRKIYETLLNKNELITSEIIKNILIGKASEKVLLIEYFESYLKEMQDLINIDFAKGTIKNYKVTKNHLFNFLNQVYSKKDISFSELEYSFVTKFEYYLKVNKRIGQNAVYKHIQKLKKFITIAIRNQWIDKDPFVNFSIKRVNVDREMLTPEELLRIEEKTFRIERLEIVKDIFIFSCYTGLAYVDIFNLTDENILTGIDGEKWIKIKRQKTGTPSSVPLLPKALGIIEKYEGKGKLLPILSNQKMNSYLKEIADFCGIKKNLTFHIARHTFATTVTLTNGVPIETVSKMLGHKSIKTTQIYSKVVEQKVSNDMKILREKLLKIDSGKNEKLFR